MSEAVSRWVFVSDVHLDVVDRGRHTAAAITEFFEHVAATSASETRLVLLGDVFELLGPRRGDESAAAQRFDAVASENAPVFAALRTCLGHGIRVDVVAGNHDLDLIRPVVADRLRQHLGVTDDDEAVCIGSWLYTVPGVLYAEHGNQHHDLNRFPRILDPYAARDRHALHTPPLAARGRRVGEGRSRVGDAGAVLRSLVASWWGERAATEPRYQARIEAYAASVGLSHRLVAELERLSRFRPGSTALRLAAQPIRRVSGRPGREPDCYLVAAAEAVGRTCSSHRAGFPLYVFGHSHVARDVMLGDGNTRYLNCGTWSAHLHPGDPATRDPATFPYVEVTVADQVRGALRWWRYRRADLERRHAPHSQAHASAIRSCS